MKEFFGFGGYLREPEGFLSFEHIAFVTFLMVVMVLLAVFIGKRFKGKSEKEKKRCKRQRPLFFAFRELLSA